MAVKAKATITLTRVDDGTPGPAGKGIKSHAITYQAGTSGTSIPTGQWLSNIPSVPQGQYLWSRTRITYTDDTTSTTYSVAYIPKNGQTGTGIINIIQQYYLSTSKTSQIGGSWVTSMPVWSKGKYLWTRYQINYKNPTSTAYTSPICDSSWEAVNELRTEYEAKLDVEKNRITANVKATNELQIKTSKLEQTAESLGFTLEQVEKDASNAGKIATNFLGFDINGLIVADRTSGLLKNNVLIGTSDIQIREGTTTVASFSKNKIALGKNDVNSVIDLCNGTGEISSYKSVDNNGNPISGTDISSKNIRIKSEQKDSADFYGEIVLDAKDRNQVYNSIIKAFSDIMESSIYITAAEKKYNSEAGIHVYNDGIPMITLTTGASAGVNEMMMNTEETYFTKTLGVPKGLRNGNIVEKFQNNLLWSGVWFGDVEPNKTSCALSQLVTNQPHGIVLVFSNYSSKEGAKDQRFNSFFVPKAAVAEKHGCGWNFMFVSNTFGQIASKYLYISDGKILGHADNKSSGTGSTGIKYNNALYVLRYVYGV